MDLEKKCKECEVLFIAKRKDKIFCSDICRMSFHREKREREQPEIFVRVSKQLNLNRRVLRRFNPGAKVTVRKDHLKAHGFDERFFTHYWKNSKNDVYLFVYEYGFMRLKEKGLDKYVLVTWQNYMNKTHR